MVIIMTKMITHADTTWTCLPTYRITTSRPTAWVSKTLHGNLSSRNGMHEQPYLLSRPPFEIRTRSFKCVLHAFTSTGVVSSVTAWPVGL